MKHNEMPSWQKSLRMREGTLYNDELVDIVARLPYWQRQKLRIWLRDQEIQEPELEETDLLEYVRKEVSSLLPLVPTDELSRVLQIVRMYAGGR